MATWILINNGSDNMDKGLMPGSKSLPTSMLAFNWTTRNKFQLNLNQNYKDFDLSTHISENSNSLHVYGTISENVCKLKLIKIWRNFSSL